jgi:hypothetical protein
MEDMIIYALHAARNGKIQFLIFRHRVVHELILKKYSSV